MTHNQGARTSCAFFLLYGSSIIRAHIDQLRWENLIWCFIRPIVPSPSTHRLLPHRYLEPENG